MSLLTPLGLLGLISILVLILIYIIKPNYQKRMVSSTYIWKLSLKYKKKRIPVSKLRNLIIFICQVLVLTLSAWILAQPIIESDDPELRTEKIAILDASASMLAEDDGVTRFERAVEQIRTLAKQVTEEDGGVITVIMAGSEATFLTHRMNVDTMSELNKKLDSLVVSKSELECTYGKADIEGAMTLAETVLEVNPNTEVLYYTGTNYIDDGEVTVKNVSESSEWNAAVLDATVSLNENYYVFTIDVACYGGRDYDLLVNCDVYGANYDEETIALRMPVRCSDDAVQTVVFDSANMDTPIYSYDYISVWIDVEDSFKYDDSLYVYGGKKEVLDILYYSTNPNTFVSGTLMGLRDTLRGRWDVELKQVRGIPDEEEKDKAEKEKPPTSGYDLYIYEHEMPDRLPTDGVVLLMNPNKIPVGVDKIKTGATVKGEYTMALGTSHTVTKYMTMYSPITVSKYTRITQYEGYDAVLLCGSDPMLLVRNDEQTKVALMPFSLHNSNLAVHIDFPTLFYSLLNYYLPSTLTDYVYDVNETVTFDARGTGLTVTGQGIETTFESLPADMKVTLPGLYTVTQTLLSGEPSVTNFSVKIPRTESNIARTEDELVNPYRRKDPEPEDLDLLLYFAAVVVALLFIEWWLQSRDNL